MTIIVKASTETANFFLVKIGFITGRYANNGEIIYPDPTSQIKRLLELTPDDEHVYPTPDGVRANNADAASYDVPQVRRDVG